MPEPDHARGTAHAWLLLSYQALAPGFGPRFRGLYRGHPPPLYEIVVAVHFTAPAEAAAGDWYPDYSPDQAGLVVWFSRGRWLAGWSRLEESASDLPESRRQALVRIQTEPGAPYGVAFYEV